jgi:hypothetical protein
MPDLGSLIVRKSVDSLASNQVRCAGCQRTPLAGERMHEMDSGRKLCDLCLGALPEKKRRTIRSERVRAGDRHIVVGPRAA